VKWTLIGIFVGLIVWSIVAYAMIPDAADDGVTVLTWVSDDNPARRGAIERFERRNPDIRVQLDPGTWGLEKIIVQCKGGIGPDVFNVYGRWQLVDFVRTGVLLPLDEYAAAYGFSPDKTWPQVLDEITFRRFNPDTGQYERHQYTFPANVNANVMFYNKRLFREAGLSYPSGDWTWDECLQVARRLTARDKRGRTIRYGIGTYEYLETSGLIWQFGGRTFDPTLTYCVVDSPEAREAIAFLHRMFAVDRVMPPKAVRDAMGTQGGYGGTLIDLFAYERIAMIRLGRWALVNLRKYYDVDPEVQGLRPLRGEIGAVQVPYRREKVDVVRAMSVGINHKGPHREAALRFLGFLATEEFSRQVVESADALPPSPKVARSDFFLHDPTQPEEDFNAEFVTALERGRNIEISPFVQSARVERAFNRYLALLGEGAIEPDQLCRELTDEINLYIHTNLLRYQSMRDEYQRRTGHPFDPDHFPPREDRP
jgi:multiple sugar transport system substrate-binding protein